MNIIKMINIISTFYISKVSSKLDKLRNIELETCFVNNLNSPFVEKIHLFVDDNESLEKLNILSNNSNKVVVIKVGKIPKYSDFFTYIINELNDKICMLINADITLYECENKLIENLKENKIVYALTRHEQDLSCPLINNYFGSHDSYIFNSKFIDKTIINEHTNFFQNILGIETHIIKNFVDNGFVVLNPCKQIKIVHYHKSELRTYKNWNCGGWYGLHRYGDDDFLMKSCWYIPPKNINL